MPSKEFDIDLFRPHYLLLNPHVQSIFSGLFLRGESFNYIRERFETPDGDFFDVDKVIGKGPCVIACHGFEGSSKSTHITRLMSIISKLGWNGYAINNRSCSGTINNNF